MPISNIIIYSTLLLLVSVISAIRWKLLSSADRCIALLMWLTTLVECTAMALQFRGRNTQWIYHFYSPTEFFLLCVYFNICIRWFRRCHIGYLLGALGVLLAIFNTIYLQHLLSIDTNFLLFEATLVSICCVFSFYQMLKDEEHMPRRLAQCWVTLCYLFFWTFTFMSWGMFDILPPEEQGLSHLIEIVLTCVNYLFYLGIAAVFFFYQKLIPSGD